MATPPLSSTTARVDVAAALDGLPMGVSILAADGTYLHANATARAFHARMARKFSDERFADLGWTAIDPEGEPVSTAELPAEITRTTGEEITFRDLGFPEPGGGHVWLRISTRRLDDDPGPPPYAVVVSLIDVTEVRRIRHEMETERARYAAVVEGLHEGLVIQTADRSIVTANARATEIFSMEQTQLVGRTSTDPRWSAVHADGTPWPGEDHPAARVLRDGEPQLDQVMGVLTDDGSRRWLRVNSTPLMGADGAVEAVCSTFVDETAATAARDELERTKHLFEHAFSDAPVGMALVDLDGSWLRVNRSLLSITGYSEEELLARTFQEITHPDDLDADLDQLRELLAGEIPRYAMEKRYITASGGVIWVHLSVSLVRRADGSPDYLVSHIKDITERRRLQESLQRLADHDALTGLWNRRRFEEELQRQAGRCRRYHERAALLLLDLDGFKRVNDTLGHKAGDDLLRSAAEAMRTRLRRTDSIARFGGDEFAVLLPQVDAERALAVAHDVAEAVRASAAPITELDVGLEVTASVGVTLLDGESADEESALIAADASMYRAKGDRAGSIDAGPTEPSAPRRRVLGGPVFAPAPAGPPADGRTFGGDASGRTIRVVHADDSGPYRRLLEQTLARYPDLRLVGSVDAGRAAEESAQHAPDILLYGGRDPGALAAVRAAAPACRIVALGRHLDPRDVVQRDADAVLLRAESAGRLAEAVRAAAA